MGTRGLTKVIYEGETRVAQYGQWDHYPSGVGAQVLSFLRGEGNIDNLKKGIKDHVKIITDSDVDKLINEFENSDGFMTMEESDKYKAKYPSLHRDTGGEILDLIAAATSDVPLVLNEDFEQDDLFCEGVYTVDLDEGFFISNYANVIIACKLDELFETDEEYIEAFALDTVSN